MKKIFAYINTWLARSLITKRPSAETESVANDTRRITERRFERKNDRNAWQTQKRTGPSAENSIMQPWTSSLKLAYTSI